MMSHRLTLASVTAIALSVSLFAVAQQPARISITTGGTGGVYYPMGGGMANVLSKHVPGLQATAEVTGGSVDNLKLINAGKAEVGFSMADAAWEATQGVDKFKDNKVNARTLMVLYPNKMHVVTVEGTGIAKLADLKGKRVSTGSPGSGTEIMALRVLEAAGLDAKKDLKQERLGAAESVNAMKDRKIDAFFWVGGVPTAAVTDLAATPGIKLKLIDHGDVVDAMNKKYGPLYVKSTIPAGSYAGQDKANEEVDVWNILVTNDKMSRPDGLQHREDAVREEARARRRPQGGREHRPQEPGRGLADPVPSGREEVPGGKGRQGELSARLSVDGGPAVLEAGAGRVVARTLESQGRTRRSRGDRTPAPAPAISEERLRKAVEYIEEDEGATSRYRGWLARLATLLLVGMSLFHLYAAVDIVPAQVLRPVHVGWVLLLVFLLFPVAKPLSQPAHVVGRRARGRRGRDHRLPAARRRRLLGPQHAARPVGRDLRRRRSSCSCWRRCGGRRAGSCCS